MLEGGKEGEETSDGERKRREEGREEGKEEGKEEGTEEEGEGQRAQSIQVLILTVVVIWWQELQVRI